MKGRVGGVERFSQRFFREDVAEAEGLRGGWLGSRRHAASSLASQLLA